ncbi:nitrile-specifier protein 1-like isoform X2 [Cotesia glomerata]|nr:nitrile-specifier protein 1-like isoform X2 [Cotesia glomerata]
MNSLVGVAFHGRKLIILTFMESLLDRTSHMQTFDLDKETMVVTPLTGDIPLSTKPFNFIIHDHYYYTVGAIRDHKEYSDVYRLNTTTFKWESVYKCTGLDRNEPKRRRGHTLVYDGSKIYIFRETLNFSYVVGKAEAVDNFQKLPAFDLTTRKWTSVETYGDKKHKPRYPKNNRGAFALTQYTDPVYYRFLLIFIQCMLLRKDSCLCTEDSVIKILGVERTVSRVLQQYTALG